MVTCNTETYMFIIVQSKMRIIGKDRVPERKRTKLVPAQSMKKHFQEFCESSTIHGVRYFGEEDRPIVERISWIVLFMICMSLNVYLILEVWKKWHDSPVIVTFDETPTPIWNVPFPAITVCSEIKSRATVFNFSHYAFSNDTDDLIEKQKGDVSLLCDDHILFNGEDYADESTIEFLEKVAPIYNDTIMACKWSNKHTQNCSYLFTKIFTDEGICYSFNMLDKEDLFREDVITEFESDNLRAIGWSQEEGYTTEALVDSYPRRALYSGTYGGLFIVPAAIRKDTDHYCKGPVEGFKVLIHNPAEFPLVGMRYLRIPLLQEVLIMVHPNIMTTSKTLRSYSPQERHCYFPSERYLSFFKIYNQPNCEIECLTNYTWLECGCVAIHMPRKEGMKICGPGKKKCMVDAQQRLRISAVNSAYKSETMGSCDCQPACTSILYNGESSQAEYDFHAVLSAYGEDIEAFKPYDASRVSIFFKDVQFTMSHRIENYGIVDFLANCGGLLGLFYGVSVLSFVELLYYSTLRLWANLKEIRRSSS